MNAIRKLFAAKPKPTLEDSTAALIARTNKALGL